ncbi:pyocin activator PrtN family protein [Halopseudomonas laoshanensis]|uniref:pyocin activator PrtN family protein n=1 Tax=Halopseudomonas laoshanensis TaxID=2268758 RepID=UPI003735460E
MTETTQKAIALRLAPAADTLERLFAVFGDELIPAEAVRERYYRNMNNDTFKANLGTDCIPLPITTVAVNNKAIKYVNIRHLAAFIEQRAYMADQELAARLTPDDTTR